MVQYSIDLRGESDGSVCVAVCYDDQQFEHRAAQEAVEGVCQSAAALTRSTVADRPLLEKVGKDLRDVFLKPIYDGLVSAITPNHGRLLITSDQAECLRLPWELLPSPDGDFLGTNCRWAILRSARKVLLPPSAVLRSTPLRIVFCSCAPIDLAPFDYEQEEEAVIRIAHQLSGNVYIEIAETGTFKEVSKLVAEVKPQIVHLSGHSILKGRMGHFAFEDERGASDLRPSPVLADALLSGNGVRILIITGNSDLHRDASQHDLSFAWQQTYAGEDEVHLVDRSRQHEAPVRPVVRHEMLGDNICGLAEGFVGRRRLLQRTGPALRNGEKLILVLAGISGSGRSTLAAHLAAVFKQDGFQVVAVQARRYDASLFSLRLLGKLAGACKRLGGETEKAIHDWFALGLALEFRGEGANPLYSVHPLQREFFTHFDRLPSEQAKAGHLAAAGFFQNCFELNIEEELHLSVTTGLVACMRHAASAGDRQRHAWAATRLSRRLQGTAGVHVARELMEPLVNSAYIGKTL